MINMPAYTRKNSVEYAKIILNVSDAVHSMRSPQFTKQLPRQRHIRTRLNISDGAFCKKNNG